MKTIYVILNGALKMSAGKAASQSAHAIAKLAGLYKDNKYNLVESFGAEDPNRIIVLEAKNEAQMHNLEHYLREQVFDVALYVDEGDYETDPFSLTAMAIGPLDKYSNARHEKLVELLEPFPLFGKKYPRWFK